MFKEGDETKLLENFDKVMSQITDTFKFDEDGEGGDDDDEELPTDMKEASAMLANLLKSANEATGVKNPTASATSSNNNNNVSSSSTAASPSKKESAAKTSQSSDKPAPSPLNPSSFFNSEFLSKLNANTSTRGSGSGLGDDDDNDELSEMEASMMEPLLSMLFSKEILYPSLKMMLENFDTYFEEKRATLSAEELAKCESQNEYIAEMCSIYEENLDTGSEAEIKKKKSQQLKRIVELLEKCGMPPSELGKTFDLKILVLILF